MTRPIEIPRRFSAPGTASVRPDHRPADVARRLRFGAILPAASGNRPAEPLDRTATAAAALTILYFAGQFLRTFL